jgi:hypothetical protein
MGTVTVLRLEDAKGRGCFEVAAMQDYTTAAVVAGLMTREEDEYAHFHSAERGCPAPSMDYALQDAFTARNFTMWTRGARFGFPSAEVAREWFPPCMVDALKANKQTLTVWEVPEDAVAASDRQCVFRRDQAKLIERLPVEALYDPSRTFTTP